MMAVITAALQAIAAMCNAWVKLQKERINNEIDEDDDSIASLGSKPSPDNELRIEQIAKRRDRKKQLISTL